MEAHMIGEGATKGPPTSPDARHVFAHVVPGTRYRVIWAFKDFDHDDHAVGVRDQITPADAGSANLLRLRAALSDQHRQATRNI